MKTNVKGYQVCILKIKTQITKLQSKTHAYFVNNSNVKIVLKNKGEVVLVKCISMLTVVCYTLSYIVIII